MNNDGMRNEEMEIKLKHYISLKKGKNPVRFFDTGNFPYLTMDYLRGRDKDIKYVDENDSLIFVQEKDILVLWDGANAGEIMLAKAGFLSSTMAKISSKTDKIENQFLFYLLKNFETTLKDFSGGTTIPHLDPEILLHSSFFIPSLKKQTAIAAFLDEKTAKIERAIAQKEKMIALLKERKQIVIQDAVTKGLNPNATMKHSGVEWIGEIPEHWEVKALRYIGTTQNGVSAGAEYFGTGFPFVSYGDVYKNTELPINVVGLAQSSIEDRINYSVKEGDIFFTRTSETIEEIGFSSTCLKTIDNATFAGFLIRFRPRSGFLEPIFSKYYFSSKLHRAFFVKEMNLVIRASLSQELLKKLSVLLPPIAEQRLIAAHIEAQSAKIDKAIALQEQQIEKLKELKATLIDSAVTGKIRVPLC